MYDLIIVGAGPGGYVAAERAGALGKKVLIVEKGALGGVCLNCGCIPTKTLLTSAKHYAYAKKGGEFGVEIPDATFHLDKVIDRKDGVVKKLNAGVAFLMKHAKAEVIQGEATFLGGTKIEVNGTTYEGKNLMIATGSSPAMPPIEGAKLPHVVTSTELLNLREQPKSLVVIGGGVIGLEFASFFSTIGTEVHVVEMVDEILPMMDSEMSRMVRRSLGDVTFHLGAKVEKITETAVTYTDSKGTTEIAADTVLMAVGRTPNSQGLESIGVTMNKGWVEVNEKMETSVPHVYAIGDITGKSLLAHSASRMGEVAVSTMFGDGRDSMRYHAIPWALYTLPEAAGCGMTETAAKDAGRDIKVGAAQMKSNGRFLAESTAKDGGMCKVVVDAKTDVILGVHMIGGLCSEMIHGAAIIIEGEFRAKDIRETIFPHPTVAEVIREACFALK